MQSSRSSGLICSLVTLDPVPSIIFVIIAVDLDPLNSSVEGRDSSWLLLIKYNPVLTENLGQGENTVE